MRYFLVDILRAYQTILVIRALMSWFPDVSNSGIGQFFNAITEPVLAPVRDFLRRNMPNSLPIDISLLVVYFGISLLMQLIYMI